MYLDKMKAINVKVIYNELENNVFTSMLII